LKSVQEPEVQSDEAGKDVGTVLEAGKWESVQAAKSKSEGHLGREPEGPRAGELSPEHPGHWYPREHDAVRAHPELYQRLSTTAFSGVCCVSVRNTPSAELESIRVAVSPG
jgi:hypothetical protein